MSLHLVLRPAAQAEFNAAAEWYEKRRPGLGHDFVAEIQRTLDSIVNNPKSCAIVHGDVREAPVSRFPYCIYFRIKTNRIVIIAVFHTSRDPTVWQGRN